VRSSSATSRRRKRKSSRWRDAWPRRALSILAAPMSNTSNNSSVASPERWAPPAVHGRTFGAQGERAERLDRNQGSALDALFAKPQAEGFAAGQAQFDAQIAQLQDRINRLDMILQLQARPFAELDAQVEKQLVTLALTVARHLVRRELRI